MSTAPAASRPFAPSCRTVPPVSRRVVRDAVPHLDRLISAVLACGRVAVTGCDKRRGASRAEDGPGEFAAQGEGGLGKTTACILVGNDPSVRSAFIGGIYFMKLDETSRDSDVVSELAHIVRDSGGREEARDILSLPQSHQFEQAADIARKWFGNQSILLIADNLWPRVSGSGSQRLDWAPTLAPIAGGPGSAFLFSTRHKHLAAYVDDPIEFDRLDMACPAHFRVARRMFEEYAGIAQMHRAVDEEAPRKRPRINVKDPAYVDVLEKILKVCDGWPMAIESAGALANTQNLHWPNVLSELYSVLPDLRGRNGQSGLGEIWRASISFAENLSADTLESRNALFYGLNVVEMRRRFGEKWITDRVAALAVFDAPRRVHASVAAVQLGTSVSQAASFLRMCVGLGFGKLICAVSASGTGALHNSEGNSGDDIALALHDLQFAFAVGLCEKRADGVKSLHEYHRELLTRLASVGTNGLDWVGAVDWSQGVERSESQYKGSREYFSRKLPNHFCSSFLSNTNVKSSSFVPSESDRTWTEMLCDFFCDFRWIRFCGMLYGRSLVLTSWALLAEVFCLSTNGRAKRVDHRIHVLSPGAQRALSTVANLLEAVPAGYFSTPEESGCPIHEKCDSGLAAQLEGRLSVLVLGKLAKRDRADALRIVDRLKGSVRTHAWRPRLCPRGAAYDPIDGEESRCAWVRYGGHGDVLGIAFVDCPGRSLIATACYDGNVRIHDIDRGGENVEVLFSEESSRASDVDAVGCVSSSEGALLASTFWDGFIRVWKLSLNQQQSPRLSGRNMGLTFRVTSVATLKTERESNGVSFYPRCVSLSGNRTRVVTGSRTVDTLHRTGRNEKVYAVNVWMLNCASSGAEGSSETVGDSSDVLEHRKHWALSLLGHRGNINAVCISHEGERVASGSSDGSVRVWRVPAEARKDSDAEVVHCVQLGRGFVWCLTMSSDAKSMFVGTDDGSVSMVCSQSGQVRSRLSREDKEGFSVVASIALVERSGAARTTTDREAAQKGPISVGEKSTSHLQLLFCGYLDGTITEWDIGEQLMLGEYGRPWGGSGVVQCIGARLRNEEESVREDDSEVAKEVELVSGYLDGRLRLWNTGRRQPVERQSTRSGRGTRGNHNLSGSEGEVCCAKWSPDKDIVAFGRARGSIDLWSFSRGMLSGIIRGHSRFVACLDFTWDGKQLVSVDNSTDAHVWSVHERKCVGVLRSSDEGFSTILFVAGCPVQVVTGGVAGTIAVWDIRNKTCIRRFRHLHRAAVQSLALPAGLEGWVELQRKGRGSSADRSSMSGFRNVNESASTAPRFTREALLRAVCREREGKTEDRGRDVALSRDSGGRRCSWCLRTGDVISEITKPRAVDTGLLLWAELNGVAGAMLDGVQFRETGNCNSAPRISLDEAHVFGGEYALSGDGRTDHGRMIVSFDRNSPFRLLVRPAVASATECRCRMKIGYDNSIWHRSIVCRAHRTADGRLSAVVGYVDVGFKVGFADVLF